MTAEIRPIGASDREAGVRLLSKFPTKVQLPWERLFTHSMSSGYPLGYGLFHQGECVGCVGTICKARVWSRTNVVAVNMSTWFVLPEFRKQSMDLQYCLQQIPNAVITNFTAIAPVRKRFDTLGYGILENNYVLLPYVPGAELLGRGLEVTRDLSAVQRLDVYEFGKDHEAYCNVVTVQHKATGRSCTVIASTPIRKFKGVNVRVGFILYISNPSVFLEFGNAVRSRLCRALGVNVLQIDSRYLPQIPPLSIVRPLPLPHLYWTRMEIEKQDVDALYSELALFGF